MWKLTKRERNDQFYFNPYVIATCTLLLLLLFSHQVVSDSLRPPWTAACQVSLSFTISPSLLKLMSIELVMPSSHLILCCPLLFPPSIVPSIRVFSNESALPVRWPKYWSFSFNISSQKNVQGWFPLGWTGWISLQSKGVLQHHSLKASTLPCSAFFMVQLSHYPVFHDHWKNHSFDYMHLCQQSDISAFLIHCLGLS